MTLPSSSPIEYVVANVDIEILEDSTQSKFKNIHDGKFDLIFLHKYRTHLVGEFP